jgi:O-antigen/teichoic acid export membrane protein
VARILGPTERGEFAVIQLWGPFIATLALVGLPDAVVYSVGREPWRARESWASATFLGLAVAIPILCLGYWCLPHLLAAQREAIISLTRLYLLSIFPLYLLGTMPLSVLRGLGHFGTWNSLRCLPFAGWLVVLVCAAGLDKGTAEFLTLGSLASYFFVCLITLPMVARAVRGPFSVSGVRAWMMFKYGLPLAASSVPYWLLHGGRLAQVYVASALEPSALGYLAVAVAWGQLMMVIPAGIGAVVFPLVAAADRDKGEVLAKIMRFSILGTAPLGILAVLVCPAGTSLLFGTAFKPAVPAAVLFIVWGSVEGLRVVMCAGLRGLGKPSAVLASDLASAAGTASLLALLVARLGVAGAGWAMLMGALVGTSLAWRTVRVVVGASERVLPDWREVEFTLGLVAGLLHQGASRSANRKMR